MANISDALFKPFVLVNGEWETIEQYPDLISFFCEHSYDCPGDFNDDNTISLYGRWSISSTYEYVFENYMSELVKIFDKYKIEKCNVLFGDMDFGFDFAEFGVMAITHEGGEIIIYESISPSSWIDDEVEDIDILDEVRYVCFNDHCKQFFKYHEMRKK